MGRECIDGNQLQMPAPPIPRPGDEVFWYQDAAPFKGELRGHDPKCRPVIRNAFQGESTPMSFQQIRLLDPSKRVGPNWTQLPEGGTICRASAEEISRFDAILGQSIPPGPKYFELITEIWHRGFEVYLVGGTVRDVLCKNQTYDVDLATTMPLGLARPLLKSMYRHAPSMHLENGFVRIGGTPESGDPFIDLKAFCAFQPGCPSARFGSDFALDVAHRDFACNAVYYDPINKVFIDPTGRGISDAVDKHLFIVHDPAVRNSRYHQGTIVIRFFKFVIREFSFTSETQKILVSEFVPCVASMQNSRRANYLRAQLLSKCPESRHRQVMEMFQASMVNFGIEDCWNKYFAPLVEDLLE